MYRTAALRNPLRYTRKSYSTVPPPSGGGTNWPLIIGGLGVAGGAGYYFTRDDTTAKGREAKAKARELEATLKSKATSIKGYGDQKYIETKADAKNLINSAEDRAQQAYDALKSNAKETATVAQQRYDMVRDSLASSRKKAADEAEIKKEEAKAGWFSWLGWGKSKSTDTKKNVATTVATGAEEAKKAAEKHT